MGSEGTEQTRGGAADRWVPVLPGVVVFLATLVVYLKTLCPTIYPGDGAELTAAAWGLGVPHPTGYPLFMVLGWVFEHLGLGSPAFSMNLLCALAGAAGAAAVWWLGLELWRLVRGEERVEMPWRYASGAAALLAGLGATWWDQSNQTEVYSLLMFFLAIAWGWGVRLVRRPSRRGLLGLACFSGFAFLHHQLFLLSLPMSAAAAWRVLREIPKPRIASTVGLAAVMFVLPLLGYLYLPLRAASNPPINWGDPKGIGGIVWHVTGKQYRGTRVLTHPTGRPLRGAEVTDHVRTRLTQMVEWLGRQVVAPREVGDVRVPVMGLVLGLLALLGLVTVARHSGWVAAGLAAALALNVLIAVLYTIADIAVYQLPLWMLTVALAMVGGASGASWIWAPGSDAGDGAREQGAHRERLRAWVAGGALLALAGYAVFNGFPVERGVNKSEATQAWDYAQAVAATLPEKAVVFTGGDYDIYPLWYAQICEGVRPDMAVVGANFVMNGWYADMLATGLPKDLEMFVTDEPPSTKQRWLTALLGGMVAPAFESGRRVFVTFAEPEIESVWGFRVKGAFQLPPPYPSGMPIQGPLVVYELTASKATLERATNLWRAKFPDWQAKMVRGRREVTAKKEGASQKESAR